MRLRLGLVLLAIFVFAAQAKSQQTELEKFAESERLTALHGEQLDEYRRACRYEREDYFRGYEMGGEGNISYNDSQFQSDDFLDPTNAYQAENPGYRRTIEVYFWYNTALTPEELQRRIANEFGRGPGSLNRLLVCAGRVRLSQLQGLTDKPVAKSPQSTVAAASPVRSVVATPRATEPPVRQIVGFKDATGETHYLGRQGTAAVAAVVKGSSLPPPTPAEVTAKRRAAQMEAEQASFQKMRSRVVHNRANDATACLKVEPTGVVSEWGIEGRFRLVNTCSHPVEASWCANTAECSEGRGSTWTIRPRGDYPIFFADADNPTIGVGACKAGDAKQPPLGEQREVARTGFSEARDLPQQAKGVTLLQTHRCE